MTGQLHRFLADDLRQMLFQLCAENGAFQFLCACGELERATILQRQREGIDIAKTQGKYKGRKPIPVDEAVNSSHSRPQSQ